MYYSSRYIRMWVGTKRRNTALAGIVVRKGIAVTEVGSGVGHVKSVTRSVK